MTAKCVGCGLDWNVSIYQKIPRTGYTLKDIQANRKERPQMTKGATP